MHERRTVDKVVRCCVKCNKTENMPCEQHIAPLPADRCLVQRVLRRPCQSISERLLRHGQAATEAVWQLLWRGNVTIYKNVPFTGSGGTEPLLSESVKFISSEGITSRGIYLIYGLLFNSLSKFASFTIKFFVNIQGALSLLISPTVVRVVNSILGKALFDNYSRHIQQFKNS